MPRKTMNNDERQITKMTRARLKTPGEQVAATARGAGETIRNTASAMVSNLKTRASRGKVARGMMDKHYVSPTAGNQTWDKRYKETKQMVGKGQYAQARARLSALNKAFHSDPRNNK